MSVTISPTALRDLMNMAGWSRFTLAGLVDASESSIGHWLSGRRTVPPDLAVWFDEVERFYRQNPPPPPPETR